MTERLNHMALIFGLQGQGKSHRAMHRAVLAARGDHPSGFRCRVFVQDPTDSFATVAPRYDSPREWASAASRAAGKPFPAIARFRLVGARELYDCAFRAADATRPPGTGPDGERLPPRVPSIVVYDEGGTVEAIRDNYVEPWFRDADLLRRHNGIGWILNCQDGALHRDVISKATEVDVFRLVAEPVLRRLQTLCNIPARIIATIPTLPPHNFRSGSPHSPESWR